MSAMNKLKHWAESERGRITALAGHLGIPASYAHRMVHGKKPVSVTYAAAIEQFTGGAVTRQQLFPDSWQRIWPELASSGDATTDQQQQPAGQGV